MEKWSAYKLSELRDKLTWLLSTEWAGERDQVSRARCEVVVDWSKKENLSNLSIKQSVVILFQPSKKNKDGISQNWIIFGFTIRLTTMFLVTE